MKIVQGGEELAVVSRKPLSQLTSQRVSVCWQYRHPKRDPESGIEILTDWLGRMSIQMAGYRLLTLRSLPGRPA